VQPDEPKRKRGLEKVFNVAKKHDRLTSEILEMAEDMRKGGLMDQGTYEQITMRHLEPEARQVPQPLTSLRIHQTANGEHLRGDMRRPRDFFSIFLHCADVHFQRAMHQLLDLLDRVADCHATRKVWRVSPVSVRTLLNEYQETIHLLRSFIRAGTT